jgi:hypothetical protein
LGERLLGDTLKDVIAGLLIRMGDPTSQARWRGIRASGRRLQLRIGGVVVLDEPFDESHPAWSHTRDIFRAAYRRNRAHVDAGLLPLEALQRWTGHEMRKYRVVAEALLPPEHVSDGSRPPRTTLNDTMVEASSDTVLESHTATGDPTTGFGWTHYEGSAVATVRAASDKAGNNASDADGRYRADSDLSSDEHRCQMEIKFASEGTSKAQVLLRKDGTGTETNYAMEWRPSGDRQRIDQVVAGTSTTLATKTTTAIGTSAFTGKGDIDSSDVLRQYINGAEEQSFDDAASPVGAGNLRCGLRIVGRVSDDDVLLDDWQAADAAAGPQTITPSPVAIVMSAIAPSIAGSGAATVTPGPVAIPVGTVAPSIAGSGAAPITPGAVAIPVSAVAPSITGSGAAPVTPGAVAIPVSAIAPAIAGSGAATISPGPVSMALAVVAPSIANAGGPQTISPAALAIVLTGVSPSVSGSGVATISPAALAILIAAVAPSIAALPGPVAGPTQAVLADDGINSAVLGDDGINTAELSDDGINTASITNPG